jgi:DNA-binding NtrC family response regulator
MAKTKLMIVEDEMIAALALRKEFENLGYEVCELVCFGEEVIENIEQESPEVVLMDIDLRGDIDGIEAAKQIHSRFGIPVVFITGYVDQKLMEQASVVNPIGYFIKPLNCKEIQVTIDAALQKQVGASGQKEEEE